MMPDLSAGVERFSIVGYLSTATSMLVLELAEYLHAHYPHSQSLKCLKKTVLRASRPTFQQAR